MICFITYPIVISSSSSFCFYNSENNARLYTIYIYLNIWAFSFPFLCSSLPNLLLVMLVYRLCMVFIVWWRWQWGKIKTIDTFTSLSFRYPPHMRNWLNPFKASCPVEFQCSDLFWTWKLCRVKKFEFLLQFQRLFYHWEGNYISSLCILIAIKESRGKR